MPLPANANEQTAVSSTYPQLAVADGAGAKRASGRQSLAVAEFDVGRDIL